MSDVEEVSLELVFVSQSPSPRNPENRTHRIFFLLHGSQALLVLVRFTESLLALLDPAPAPV